MRGAKFIMIDGRETSYECWKPGVNVGNQLGMLEACYKRNTSLISFSVF